MGTTFLAVFFAALAWGAPVTHRALDSLPRGFDLPRGGHSVQVLAKESLQFAPLETAPQAGGQWALKGFSGAGWNSAPGLPSLPVVTRRYPLPAGRRGTAWLEAPVFEQTEGLPRMAVGAPTYVWGPQPLSFPAPEGRFFPGRWITSREVGGELWVTIHPVQWDGERKEMLVMRSAQLQVGLLPENTTFTMPAHRGPKSLIVTRRPLEPVARELQKFQRSFGVDSELLFLESLEGRGAVSESELPDGYREKDPLPGILSFFPESGSGYDYQTARRLIRFLWDQMVPGKALRYVTLLGDGTVVPPSFYFAVPGAGGGQIGVTDQCYAANEGCLVPRLAVGRLPLHSLEQWANYRAKVEAWFRSPGTSGPELALFGGKAFRGYQFIGELGALRALPSVGANWAGVTKNFRTLGSHNHDETLALVKGAKRARLAYYLDHGRGNEWYAERDYVSAAEVNNAEPETGGLAPFIVSISCTNAAFDVGLLTEPVMGPADSGATSVGVALIQSKAGAVGYLGSARPALGNPVFELDPQGNMAVTGSTYGLEIFDGFVTRYHALTEGRAGDLVVEALQKYTHGAGHDLRDPSHLWTYLNVAYLGDPTLPLLPRRQFNEVFQQGKSGTRFDAVAGGLPGWWVGEGETSLFTFALKLAQKVRATLFKVDRYLDQEVRVAEADLATDATAWAWEARSADARGVYLLKMENQGGVPVEGHVWFGVGAKPPSLRP